MCSLPILKKDQDSRKKLAFHIAKIDENSEFFLLFCPPLSGSLLSSMSTPITDSILSLCSHGQHPLEPGLPVTPDGAWMSSSCVRSTNVRKDKSTKIILTCDLNKGLNPSLLPSFFIWKAIRTAYRQFPLRDGVTLMYCDVKWECKCMWCSRASE